MSATHAPHDEEKLTLEEAEGHEVHNHGDGSDTLG